MAYLKKRLLLLLFLVIGFGGYILSAVWMIMCIIFAPNGTRAKHITLAYDQLGNATTGGDIDETISSRAGRLRKQGRGWACVLCKVLDWLDKNHCEKSIGT